MASGKNKNGRDDSRIVSNIVSAIEDNSEQPTEIYLAQKTIQHSGKVFKAGEVVEIGESDLQRLIKLGAVKLQDDGFPRLN